MLSSNLKSDFHKVYNNWSEIRNLNFFWLQTIIKKSSVGTRSNSVWPFFGLKTFNLNIFLNIWFQIRIENQILNKMNTWMAIFIFVLKKIQTKNQFPTSRIGQTGFFEYFGLYFFEINIMMAIQVFILIRIWYSIRILNQISKKIFKLNF
jgi:hypothetical protein